MDTRKIYIGEVYNRYIENSKCITKKIGWGIFYTDGINYYGLKNNKRIDTDVFENIYLDVSSLISYLSFAKTSLFTYNESIDKIITNSRKKISMLEEKDIIKKYGYYYSKEELEIIHRNNELTIYEKANQILEEDSLQEITGESDGIFNRKEYVYKVLRKSGRKSFER